MTLHDLITLMILSIGTSRPNEIQYMKYKSEYILKLQKHQHSLLTRKVFSCHNSSAHVFFSGSSSKLDHHQIIIKVGSSLDHHHHCFRYLDQMVLSLNSTRHRKFYKPTLFHVGCRPSLHVGLHLLQYLYLTMGGTHPASMSKIPSQHLYLTMGGTHPISMS